MNQERVFQVLQSPHVSEKAAVVADMIFSRITIARHGYIRRCSKSALLNHVTHGPGSCRSPYRAKPVAVTGTGSKVQPPPLQVPGLRNPSRQRSKVKASAEAAVAASSSEVDGRVRVAKLHSELRGRLRASERDRATQV